MNSRLPTDADILDHIAWSRRTLRRWIVAAPAHLPPPCVGSDRARRWLGVEPKPRADQGRTPRSAR